MEEAYGEAVLHAAIPRLYAVTLDLAALASASEDPRFKQGLVAAVAEIDALIRKLRRQSLELGAGRRPQVEVAGAR